MNTVVFIETTKSGSSREAIKAADRLGYATVLVTESKRFFEQREEFTDVTQMITVDKITEEQARDQINLLQKRGHTIKGIFSFVDPFVSMAAHLMNEYCGSGISVEALRKMEDKVLTRTALADNPVTPEFHIYNPAVELEEFLKQKHQFPLIIKSPLSKASRDVYLAENKYEMKKIMKKMLVSEPAQKIVIEEYLEGPQYLIELVVNNGEIDIVAVIKQDIKKELKFIVTGYDFQLNLDKNMYAKLDRELKRIFQDLGAVHVACHLEMRYVDGSWKLIELNPRISGGAMNRMVEEAYGINLVEETMKLFMNGDADLEKKHAKHIYTHYITIGTYGQLLKVTGKNRASKQAGVREVYVKPRKGAYMTPALSMGSRYGYVIASGESASQARKNALNAAEHIKFYIEPN